MPRPSPVRRDPRRMGASILAATAVALTLSACKPDGGDVRTRPPLVRVVAAQAAHPAERGYTGIIGARVQGDLGFRVGGKVIERLVDTGQKVRAGQPLMRLDRTDYGHAVTARAGDLAAVRARQIQAVADEARYHDLVASGAVSQSAYDQVKAAADSARAQVDAAQAQLTLARDDDSYTTLLADADGTVVETLVEPGQVVAAGQVVARLAHAGPREAVVDLPETVRPPIGSVAQATIYGADVRYAARLRQLSDAADPRTRTYEARYVLDGVTAAAPLGATVTVYLASGTVAATATAVPLSAINDEGRGPGVWVLDAPAAPGATDSGAAGTVQVAFRPVRIAQLGAESAILDGGLTAGEHIVALGGHELRAGQRVRVAGQESAPQPGAEAGR